VVDEKNALMYGDDEFMTYPPQKNERVLGTTGLFCVIFFEVGGGIGMDEAIRHGGIFWSLVGMVTFPLIFAVPLALVTAELATSFPENGGQVAWARHAFGHRMGFMQGVASLIANIADIATLGVLAIDYMSALSALEDDLTATRTRIGLGIAVVFLSAAINLRGAAVLEKYSIGFALISILPIIGIVAAGASEVNPAIWLRKRPAGNIQKGRLLSTLFWNNSGYDLAGSCAGEVKDPARVFPLALSLAVAVSTACYVFPIAVAVCTKAGQADADWTDNYLSTAIAVDLGGNTFKVLSCCCSAVSAIGMCCSAMLSASREVQYMATESMAPAIYGVLHP